MDYSAIRGFNYQPSYGRTGFEIWQLFDAAVVDEELGRGKTYFPQINAVRLWLSWESFTRGPERFLDNFEAALAIAARHDLLVMPVLFNRWHSMLADYGGIYIDHFMPGISSVPPDRRFGPYLEDVVGRHAADTRIFAWDLCNEPFSYACAPGAIPEIVAAEYGWLADSYDTCKRLGAVAPITVGIHANHGVDGIRQVEPISDVLSIHPYWPDKPPNRISDKSIFEQRLDDYAAFAADTDKPLLATETCWGAVDDLEHVDIIRYTLSQLKQRGIGWLAYVLHHSLTAYAYAPEFGPMSGSGNMSFIGADGAPRQGHEVFNEF